MAEERDKMRRDRIFLARNECAASSGASLSMIGFMGMERR
jgi:hypothetical protein